MKKNVKSKRTVKKSKRTHAKSSSISAAGDQDVLRLLATLVEKLTSFEAKLDTVLDRVSSRPLPQPVPVRQPFIESRRPAIDSSLERRRDGRPMHKAICAECRTYCEVPFKPSGERPVYCKDCYRARRNGDNFKPRHDERPREIKPVYAKPFERGKSDKKNKSSRKRPAVAQRFAKKKKAMKRKK